MDDGKEVISVAVPAALNREVEEACRLSGLTLVGLLRRAAGDVLNPPNRVYELAGLSRAFDEFLERADLTKWLGRSLILVADGPRRVAFDGNINIEPSKKSGIVFMDAGGSEWIIPRKDIIGWYADGQDHSRILDLLEKSGWEIVGRRTR